jgi:hypothetical protein
MKKYTSAELVKEILSKATDKQVNLDNVVAPKDLYESLKKNSK